VADASEAGLQNQNKHQNFGKHTFEKLSSLKNLHYATNKSALLLIFQGMDAAGKYGAIRHVMSGVNPQGCEVSTSNSPAPRSWNMQTTTNAQMGLLDSLMIATMTNEFLEWLDGTLDWKPIERALKAIIR
jgi:hypothetical protein